MKVGDRAPDFTLYSHAKNAFHLGSQDTPVVLLFFPGAFTGVCTTELNHVSNDLESYAPATVVGISTDSPFALAAYAEQQGFRMPLLSDHDASVSAVYGSKYNKDFTPMKLDRIAKRSAFVIDAGGVIRYAEVLENAGEIPDLDAVKNVLAAL